MSIEIQSLIYEIVLELMFLQNNLKLIIMRIVMFIIFVLVVILICDSDDYTKNN